METITELPIIAPLLALLRSRKFLTLVSALVVNVIIAKVPELASARDILIGVTTLTALALIGGIAWEDAAQGGREAAVAEVEPTEELIRKIVGELLNSYLPTAPAAPPQTTVNVVTPPQAPAA